MALPDSTRNQQLNDSGSQQLPADNAQLSSQGRQQAESDKLVPQSAPGGSTLSSNPKLQALHDKKIRLEETLAQLQTQKSALVAEAKLSSGLPMPDTWSDEERAKSAMATANWTIKEHIALLHKYNEIKDIGQGLMGLIADQRDVRVATVMEEYGMSEKD